MAIAFRIIMAENKNTNIIHLNYELWGDEEEGSRNFSKKYVHAVGVLERLAE